MTKCFALIFTLTTLLTVPAQAVLSDINCDDSARLTRTLSQVLGAERQGAGLRDPETMVEVWVIGHNGDWLIVQNYTNGTSCIVAMGEYWEAEGRGPA